MIASRGDHTCVSRNTGWRPPKWCQVSTRHNCGVSKVVCLVVPRGVPSGGAGKGGVSPPLLVEEGLLNGTLWRIRGNFGVRSLELIWARGQRFLKVSHREFVVGVEVNKFVRALSELHQERTRNTCQGCELLWKKVGELLQGGSVKFCSLAWRIWKFPRLSSTTQKTRGSHSSSQEEFPVSVMALIESGGVSHRLSRPRRVAQGTTSRCAQPLRWGGRSRSLCRAARAPSSPVGWQVRGQKCVGC